MLTFETFPRFERDWKNLTSQQQAMFRKTVLEAFVPDLMARTARSSQACVKELPNITMQLEPRPSLMHRVPDVTVGAPVATFRCRRSRGCSRWKGSLNAAGCSNVAKVLDDLAE